MPHHITPARSGLRTIGWPEYARCSEARLSPAGLGFPAPIIAETWLGSDMARVELVL